MVFVFATFEFGYAFYGRLTIRNMSLGGARSASSQGADVYSDHSILTSVRKNASDLKPSEITMVVIYRATGPSDRVPTACKSSSVTNTSTTRGCNRYTGSQLTLAQDQFGCVDAGGNPVQVDRFWCPTTRKTALSSSSSNGPPDYVGVYVESTQPSLTRMFGKTSYTFTSDTVIRIEPRSAT
jgi:Flp pilus assembly protein TadG